MHDAVMKLGYIAKYEFSHPSQVLGLAYAGMLRLDC